MAGRSGWPSWPVAWLSLGPTAPLELDLPGDEATDAVIVFREAQRSQAWSDYAGEDQQDGLQGVDRPSRSSKMSAFPPHGRLAAGPARPSAR